MKPFLTVHQTDPRLFFVERFLSERCAVTSLPDNMRLFMLHEPNRSFSFLHAKSKEGNSEQRLIKEGFCRVVGGSFYCLDACLLGGHLCAILARQQTRPAVTRKSKQESMTGQTDGWPFDKKDETVHCSNLSLSLSLSPPLSLCLRPAFVSHVVITAQTGESVCSCRIP